MREQVKSGVCSSSRIHLTLAIGISVCVVGLVGCVAPERGIPIAYDIEQNDIPVPELYRFLGSETPDYGFVEDAAFRSWTGHYRGGGRIDDLVPWYIEEMNTLGWNFMRLEGESEHKQLFFRKENEAAEIEIERRFASDIKSYANYVDAEIHPLGVENYTVTENLERFGQIQPVSYTAPPSGGEGTLDAKTPRLEAPVSEGRGSLELERARALREIEAIERS